MLAVIAAILFAIALVLHLLHQSEFVVEAFDLAGMLFMALSLIPAVPVIWRSRQ